MQSTILFKLVTNRTYFTDPIVLSSIIKDKYLKFWFFDKFMTMVLSHPFIASV